jgi:hypothetical protein
VHLGMVDPERLDLDDDMTGLRLGLGYLLVNQAVQSAEFLKNDGPHSASPE